MNLSGDLGNTSLLARTVSEDYGDASEEVFFIVQIVTNVILANVLSLLGIIGSILNIIILSRHGMQDTTNIILLSISLCDFIYSVTQTQFNFLYTSYFFFDFYYYQWIRVVQVSWTDTINYVALIISIHLVTLVSIERMIAVCFPFHISRMFTLHRIKIAIIFIVVFNFAIRAINFFRYSIAFIDYKNISLPTLNYEDFYMQNIVFFSNFDLYTFMIFFSCGPFVVVSFCTCITIWNVSVSSKTKATLSSTEAIDKRRKQMKSIKTVLILCVLNIFLVLIPILLYHACTTLDLVKIPLRITHIMFWILNILVQINSSLNFLLYVTSSPKFKMTAMRLIFKQKVEKKKRM